MKNNPYYLYCALMIGMLIGVVSMSMDNRIDHNPVRPQIKPCNCLTYSQWQILSTKRDMLIDKRKLSKTDSVSLDSINVALGIYK